MTTAYTGSNWIDELSPDLRSIVRERMSSRWMAKGGIIYREGQVSQALWQITRGSVRVTNQALDGKEVVFAIFTTGDCLGEISLIDSLPAANTATAMEAVELAELSRADFDELFNLHPAFARQVAQLLTARVRHLMAFYADVTLRPLEQRIARRIIYLSFGGVGGSAAPSLLFTQQDLAAMVGATRQAVSKVLSRWRTERIIALEYGSITVLLPEVLQAIAGEEFPWIERSG